jgi:Ca2+-binding EF-hand superfamily protein
MKKLIIIALAASGAVVAQAQAETSDQRSGRGEFRAEMRALIAGDGMDVAALANLMQEHATARFEALDADGDGIVTKDDVLAAAAERAQSRFERMGPNEDGIVKHEGRNGWRKHGERGERAERGERRQPLSDEQRAERMQERTSERFARLDTDGDGMISPEEFQAGATGRMERFAEHRERRAERRAELPEEMREMHAQFRTMMREGMDLDAFSGFARDRASARFDAMDADGNGELTADEFTAEVSERAERVFARMDRNEDGMVTSDDRPNRAGKRGDGPRSKD